MDTMQIAQRYHLPEALVARSLDEARCIDIMMPRHAYFNDHPFYLHGEDMDYLRRRVLHARETGVWQSRMCK